MPKKPRRLPTPAELKIIRTASGLGQPVEEIAALCEVSKTMFDKYWAKLAEVQDARAQGKAVASNAVRDRLFRKATKEGDIRALEFWAKCQLGFRTADRLELTGADGKPLNPKAAKEVTRDDVANELAALRARLEEKYD